MTAGIQGLEHSEKDKDSRGYTGESTGRQGRVGREQALHSSVPNKFPRNQSETKQLKLKEVSPPSL